MSEFVGLFLTVALRRLTQQVASRLTASAELRTASRELINQHTGRVVSSCSPVMVSVQLHVEGDTAMLIL